jgi:hypothetical protein
MKIARGSATICFTLPILLPSFFDGQDVTDSPSIIRDLHSSFAWPRPRGAARLHAERSQRRVSFSILDAIQQSKGAFSK